MSEVAIRVEGLGKRFRIARAQRPTLLREALVEGMRTAGGLLAGRRAAGEESFWALRGVSFEVPRGEAVGIVGGNGAGKSTLLKVLARITEPTEGDAWIHGRVGSLLEVGTGFHPELTGRENTYLSGAVLGMKRAEIDRRFDEIVAFAEVEKFIDTPVKHYSSGMYLRIAFAVAAHLEPEVLIVDEVLAVGDASFQRKCLGKMGEVTREGRTVLFVSHNMAAVQSLCSHALLLRGGGVDAWGPVGEVVTRYLQSVEQVAAQRVSERTDRRGRGEVRLTQVEVSAEGHLPPGVLAAGRPARFAFQVDGRRAGISVWFTIYDQFGQAVSSFHSLFHGPEDSADGEVELRFVCELPDLPLVPGRYRVNAAVYTDGELQDHVEGAALFQVAEGVLRGRPVAEHSGQGSVRLHHRWRLPRGAVRG